MNLTALALAIGVAVGLIGPWQEKPATPQKGTGKTKVLHPPISESLPTQTGPAPVRVELGDPIQPNGLQTREGGQVVTDPRARYRTVVRMMIHVERTHREHVARIERLHELFTQSGATDSLETVARLRVLERARYEAAMAGYERGLGAPLYARVRAVLDANGIPAAVLERGIGGGSVPVPAKRTPDTQRPLEKNSGPRR